jgi:hypothetical protein
LRIADWAARRFQIADCRLDGTDSHHLAAQLAGRVQCEMSGNGDNKEQITSGK